MKRKLIPWFCLAIILIASNPIYSQDLNEGADIVAPVPTDSLLSNKVEKNRNVMLNAEGNTGPRNVNIGLPFRGDVIILENDVPVVYYFWPTIPTFAWRNSTSLSKMGLLSFAEGALTFGKVGYAVQSSDREASSKFRGYASFYGNDHGSSRYDVTVTGPIANGWGYMLNAHQNYDRGNNTNYMYTPWADKTTMVKAALQKSYKKGYVRAIYKMVDSKAITTNYYPLRYLGNGKTEALSNFDLGTDSYSIRDGMIPYYHPVTGESGWGNLNRDEFNRSTSHNIYLNGEHRFNKGWKLTYTSMFQYMNSPVGITFPLSIGITEPDQRSSSEAYYYHGTNKPYDGSTQMVINQMIPQSKNHYFVTRAELTKKLKGHNLRFGFNYQQNKRKFLSYGGLFIQSVEANPVLLDRYYIAAPGMEVNLTPNGLMPGGSGGYGSYNHDEYKKTALYVSDDFSPTKWLDLGFGFRIEHQNKKEVHNPTYTDEFIGDTPLITKKFNNDWNKVAVASAVVKLTKNFGLVGDFTYNSWWDSYWEYSNRDDNGNPIPAPGESSPRSNIPETFEQEVINFGAGVFYNLGDKLSVVSKITGIRKNNNRYTSATVTNPANTLERADFSPIFYDINTIGWSTDVVTSPFKNFNLHFLLTLQKPKYKNFSYGAFGVEYSYNDKYIPELSQVLMEIDPSYSFMSGKMRAWVSLRYFGKQYANPTNAFTYDGWWENFGGLDYRLNRNINLKLQVTNFLNQKGVKGAVQGADQAISDEAFIGRPVVAGAIRPRTVELSVDFKF